MIKFDLIAFLFFVQVGCTPNNRRSRCDLRVSTGGKTFPHCINDVVGCTVRCMQYSGKVIAVCRVASEAYKRMLLSLVH
ncbi:hypothetical protein F443_05891 [Phytophthora nicotianae P1569]|uniref:Secreted protein n=1 Tax=Phytophthora nicotianae P1569 TaxID=1317065 RepID=V9FHM6_PHYNI|nr:hypothetical protein F443_05891 [Phytophthora nicotianae P1569]